jgi:hypothetical protein
MTIVENQTITVTGGVDTHLDFHVAAAIDSNGGVLGVETFDTTTSGYRQLVARVAIVCDRQDRVSRPLTRRHARTASGIAWRAPDAWGRPPDTDPER